MTENTLQILANIVERSPAVAFVWKLEDHWPVMYVSNNVDQFGYSAEQFISGDILYGSIVHPDDINRVAGEVTASIESGVKEFSQQYPCSHQAERFVGFATGVP